jgi:hypothetical protein
LASALHRRLFYPQCSAPRNYGEQLKQQYIALRQYSGLPKRFRQRKQRNSAQERRPVINK